ncbi:MAG: hypothetical protein JWO37_838 [Acidimicrobiales bacterium]|nr:hypothetical protein [Acidimicrobiales bacterium]
MGRFRITDDIVRHLTTFQRLGETVEVQLPTELLPIGARTVFRALRTRAASQLGVDWVWPYWLERQVDPRDPAFVPRGHLPFLANITNRNWTMVGNVASPWEAIVDPRGLVTPWYDGWSLDWWVGADDRWHVPSRDSGVRQRLVDSAPIVETAMRVPGGDVIHRAYAVQADEEYVVIEIENASRLPVAIALAVRPYNPEGLAVVERVALHDRTVTVDGRPALLFPRPPSRATGSTFRRGDSAAEVFRGTAADALPDPLRCEAGLAQAAFLFPLAHQATLQVALPLVAERRTRRRRLARRRVERMPEIPAGGLPPSAVVARGWRVQTDRGMRLVLPDARLAEAVDANRRYLLLLHDGTEITPGPATYHRFWFRDAAYMLAALDRYGFHGEATEVISHFQDRQRVDGFFFSQRQEWDSNGAALWSMAEHWRLTGELVADGDSVSRAVRWIGRKLRGARRDEEVAGLMPPGISAEHLGPFDHYYWDSFWSWRGLLDGAAMLRHLGRDKQAAAAEEWAAALGAALDRSMARVAAELGGAAVPAGPRRHLDPAMIGSLVACWPLALYRGDEPRMAATADVIRERFCIGDAFFQGISHTGLGTYLTMQLAFAELDAGDRRALARLQWLLGAATPTWTWPEAIHPQLGGGCMGDGHHGWAAADFLSMVRALLVREVDGGLALCSMLPDHWLGQGIEVHDAPTHAGLMSFAVRWHGDRPALLWDLKRRGDGSAPVTLTARGLDPAWSSTEARGEALLATPPELQAAAGGFS